jgi:hypothetical protein
MGETPEVIVFCALSVSKTYGSFLFAEHSIIFTAYLGMLELWLMPQLEEAVPTHSSINQMAHCPIFSIM